MSARVALVLVAYGLPALGMWAFYVAHVAHELGQPDEETDALAEEFPRPLVAMVQALAVSFVALLLVPLCLAWPWMLLAPRAHVARVLRILGGNRHP
jgi:hypothetical protein